MIPESEYDEIRKRALSHGESSDAALMRLKKIALGPEVKIEPLMSDLRAAAILRRHS